MDGQRLGGVEITRRREVGGPPLANADEQEAVGSGPDCEAGNRQGRDRRAAN